MPDTTPCSAFSSTNCVDSDSQAEKQHSAPLHITNNQGTESKTPFLKYILHTGSTNKQIHLYHHLAGHWDTDFFLMT